MMTTRMVRIFIGLIVPALRPVRAVIGLLMLLMAASAQGFNVAHVGVGSSSEQLIMQRLVGDGDGVQISNLSVEHGRRHSTSANQRQIGYFTNGTGPLGISDGVIFTTGRINDITRSAPDGSQGNNRASYTHGTRGRNIWLQQYVESQATYDPVVVSFDIIPERDTLNMQMVFASEEYPNYACSNYNDGFAVFITGGEFGSTPKNIAIDPATQTTISINNINGTRIGEDNSEGSGNCGSAQSYRPNHTSPSLAFNGMTVPITIAERVTPNQPYRVSIQIADAADGQYDSAGFFGFLSSSWSTEADLSLALTTPNPYVQINTETTLVATVTNDGPDDSFGVAVDLPLPANLSFVDAEGDGIYSDATNVWSISHMPAGESRTITLTVRGAQLGEHTLFSEIITATADDPDSTPGNGAQEPPEDDEASLTIEVLAQPPQMCLTDATDAMVLGGMATVEGATRQIILTEDIGNQAGAAWSQERISLAQPFTMEFAVYLGTKDADGADGIAFAFHNDPGGNTVTGDYGGALGVGGLSPAVAIEFDTWDNGPGYGDIANDHTMIYNPATYTDQTGGNNSSRYTPVFDLGNIEDGEWHDVSITWEPISKTLAYHFDGALITTLQRDLIADDFGGDPNVFYGFTASTGGSSNLQKACLISVPPQSSTDYGDAPASYGNPSHEIVDGIRLGDGISGDVTGYDDPLAAADDFDDGVTLPAVLPSSQDIVVAVHGAGGYLQGWIDWNGNGVFDEPEDRIATDLQDEDNDGIIHIRLPDPPPGAASGHTYARFRWSTTAGLGPTEAATDGEVEDYRITLRDTFHCPLGDSTTGGGIAPAGDGPYRDAVYWLDWQCGPVGVFPAGAYIYKQWQFGPVEIRGRLRDLTHGVSVYHTGDWEGDLLDDLYQGVNPIGLANAVSGQAPAFTIDWEVFLDGQQIPADMIIADAEDTDDGESLVFRTDGEPWEVFAVASQTDDLLATFGNGGRELTLSSISGYDGVGSLLALTQDVTRTEHVITGSGHQAVAFGVFVQVDHGDIAAGYPQSGGHLSRRLASGGSKPTSPTDVRNLTLAQLGAAAPYLGEIPPTPEDADQNSPDADADGIEEDGVTFPTLIPGQPATLRIQVTEDVIGQAYVQGWIDWRRNGHLDDPDDQVALNVQDNGPLDNDPAPGWISLDVLVPEDAHIGDTYARFRISTTPDVTAGPMVVFDGEVEDYKIRISPLATAGQLRGRVFADTGLGATAHDGIQGGAEPGLANVLVQLMHDADGDGQCSATDTELASALTNGEGEWQLQASLADVGKDACIVVQVPASHRLVSENTGGHPLANADPLDGRMALTVQAFDTDVSGILFGLVPRATLVPDQLGSLMPGSSIVYAHRYTAGTEGSLTFLLAGEGSTPATPGWSAVLYQDEYCDGILDDTDTPLTGSLAVTPGESLCLLVQVFAPADAPFGAQHQLTLEAQLQLTGSVLTDTVSVADITRVLSGQLHLEKRVRNIGADGVPGTADDGDSTAVLSNQAAPGEVLRYSLQFHNAGTKPLEQLRIHDATPPFTALATAAECPAQLAEGLTGCTVETLDGANGVGYQGGLRWLFTGRLAAGAQGTVKYDVRVAE